MLHGDGMVNDVYVHVHVHVPVILRPMLIPSTCGITGLSSNTTCTTIVDITVAFSWSHA